MARGGRRRDGCRRRRDCNGDRSASRPVVDMSRGQVLHPKRPFAPRHPNDRMMSPVSIDPQSPEVLPAAWAQPAAAIHRRTGILSQKLSAMCGPTSVVMVLRSLGIDVDPSTLFDGTSVRTLFGARLAGMTLDQVAEVVRAKSERTVTALRDLD